MAWNRELVSGVSCLTMLLGIVGSVTLGDEPDKDSLERNYATELPRIDPLTPEEASGRFQIVDGFRVELVASEPLVADPVAISFDENGRLFVAEMRGYSENDTEMVSRIRRLEDTDGDGRFDRSSVYVDKLSWPTAVICYDGGIFVADAPDILYFRDMDGDGKADERRVVFTGFAKSNVQGLLNSFQWGLDNRIHVATSSSGGEVTRVPKAEGVAPVVLRGRDFAFDPRTLAVTVTSGGAQHGMSFNQWGDKFVCSNSDHLQHVVFEDRYVARNPYFAAPSPRRSIAVDGPQAEVFRISPVEPWRIVRTRLRVQGIVPGPVEGGGRAAGYFTGATGVTIYRGNAWPSEFAGWAFVGDVGSNLVHRKRLDPRGVTFEGRRVDEKREFLASSDIWFRPCQFANAPDGTLYVLDMYREVIEHPASLPPVIKKHLDLTSGRDLGRIYRIVPQGFRQPPIPNMGKATTAELVAALGHANGWHRDTALRLLYERQDTSAVASLGRLAASCPLPEGRITSLYALSGLGCLADIHVLGALKDPHPRVREHGLRLSESMVGQSSAVREQVYALADDPETRVRYQLAFSLGEVPGPRKFSVLASLILRDPEDPYFRVAIMSSLKEGAGQVLSLLGANNDFRKSARGREWLATLAAQIGRQQHEDDVAELIQVVRALTDDASTLESIIRATSARRGSELDRKIAEATSGQSEKLMRGLVERAAAAARDSSAKISRRAEAIRTLRFGQFAEYRSVFTEFLLPSQPVEIHHATLDTLASYSDAEVADLLIEAWPAFSPRLRTMAADILGSRETWLIALLRAIVGGTISAADLDPARMQLFAAHSNPAVRTLAGEIARNSRSGSRQEVLAAYRGALEKPGDVEKGKAIFAKVCAACHQVNGVGIAIGPNLATMKNRGPEAILTNILAPNQEVNPQYVNYLVVTTDGRQLTGMIAAETATSVTLVRAENQKDTVLRIDIEEMRGTGASLMPEGLEKQIDHQAMADLLAFLKVVE